MDSEWSLLHRNPRLPEFNLPTKEERYMQNRTVQLRAEYRKREAMSLSPTPRKTRSGQLAGPYLLPTKEMFSLGNRNWTVQFTVKIFFSSALLFTAIQTPKRMSHPIEFCLVLNPSTNVKLKNSQFSQQTGQSSPGQSRRR